MKVESSPIAIKYCEDKGISMSEFHKRFDRDLDIIAEHKISIEEIKGEFGDCDWMRASLNGYAVDAILWLMDRVEELEQEKEKDDEPSM